jgi:hypothetical protein
MLESRDGGTDATSGMRGMTRKRVIVLTSAATIALALIVIGWRYQDYWRRLYPTEPAHLYLIDFSWNGNVQSLHVLRLPERIETRDQRIRQLATAVVKKFASGIAKAEGLTEMEYRFQIQLSADERVEDIDRILDGQLISSKSVN